MCSCYCICLDSLPATLIKVMDYPTFGSSGSLRKKDGNASGISTPSSSLSRFSSQTMQVTDDIRSDVWPPNGPSPLSNESSTRNEDLSYAAKSSETTSKRNLSDNSKNAEAHVDSNDFHFSIYKWASSGVPIVMPLRKGVTLKLEEQYIYTRSSSSKGNIKSEPVCESLLTNACSTDTHSISVKSEFSKVECDEIVKKITLRGAEACLKEGNVKPVSDVLETTKVTVENKSEEPNPNFLPDKVFEATEEASKPMQKPLRSILRDDIDEEGNMLLNQLVSYT